MCFTITLYQAEINVIHHVCSLTTILILFNISTMDFTSYVVLQLREPTYLLHGTESS